MVTSFWARLDGQRSVRNRMQRALVQPPRRGLAARMPLRGQQEIYLHPLPTGSGRGLAGDPDGIAE